MKIFISWSGEKSRLVAELLNSWIQCVLQAVDPWLSSKDIDRGSLWFSEITNQLSTTHNGIVCLTKSNMNNPWILFESGALAKGITSNRVYTFLIDLEPNDIKDPLAQFNHTRPTKEGVYHLIRTINVGLGDQLLKESILTNVFETYWPQFEKEFKLILKENKDQEVIEQRPKEDILNEILSSVRGIDKRLRRVEDLPLSRPRRESIETEKTKYPPLETFSLSIATANMLKALKITSIEQLLDMDALTDWNNLKEGVQREVKELIAFIKVAY